MQKVAVVGAGSWGTTAASLLVRNVPTTLWARRKALADEIRLTRHNSQYLPGHELPETLGVTSEIDECVAGADVIVMVVPSHGLRDVLAGFGADLPETTTVISLTKGIEQSSLATMTRVIAEICPQLDEAAIGVLTGPNLAQEVIVGQPTAAVVAMRDPGVARAIQEIFMGPTFRVYTHDDVIGCELGGALKNVMAIAAGMSDGLGFGDNTRASLITRALAELTRLGVAMGGRSATFSGLAGMGDLIATCISTQSRNHRVGVGLAHGKSLDAVIEEMRMVAEGVKTTRAVLDLADVNEVDMPIARHVAMVLYDGVHPRDAVLELMSRTARAEPELLD